MMGCMSQRQHPKCVPSKVLRWLPAPGHQQHPWGWGAVAAGLTLPKEAAAPPSSSPEVAAFLRWAISSLLRSGNANSRVVWKEVTPP